MSSFISIDYFSYLYKFYSKYEGHWEKKKRENTCNIYMESCRDGAHNLRRAPIK